jgi:hypothetical protein
VTLASPPGAYRLIKWMEGTRAAPKFSSVPEAAFDTLAESLRNPVLWVLMHVMDNATGDLVNTDGGIYCVALDGSRGQRWVIVDSHIQPATC